MAVLWGLLLVGLAVTAALQGRPLLRAWYLRELRRDPERIPEYARMTEHSLKGEVLLEYVKTEEGGAAFVDFYLSQPVNRSGGMAFYLQVFGGMEEIFLDYSLALIPKALASRRTEVDRIPMWEVTSGDPGSWPEAPRLFLPAMVQLVGRTLALASAPGWSATIESRLGSVWIHLTPPRSRGVVPSPRPSNLEHER